MNIARLIATVIIIGCERLAAIDSDQHIYLVLLWVCDLGQLNSTHLTRLDGYFIKKRL